MAFSVPMVAAPAASPAGEYEQNAHMPAAPLKKNTVYTLSFWYKTRDMKGEQPKLFIVSVPGKDYEAIYLECSDEWRRYQKSFNTGEMEKLSAYFSFFKRTGDWWVDDVALTESKTDAQEVK